MWGREDAPVPVATGSVVAVAPPPRWVSFFLGVRLGVQCWQIPRMVRVCVCDSFVLYDLDGSVMLSARSRRSGSSCPCKWTSRVMNIME